MKRNPKVAVVGAGLAGSEAAWYLAQHSVEVVLFEIKRKKLNPAQKIPWFAELVCTNSLKSLDPYSSHGLLKAEMKALGSIIMEAAEKFKVPAGDALAVERDGFSRYITSKLQAHPLIQVWDEEVTNPLEILSRHQCDQMIIATGPLTNQGLESWLIENLSKDDFYFYDAIAPIVDADSLDYSKLYFKDRHKTADESADYLNAPMNKEQYEAFIEELIKAEKVAPKNFEKPQFFESCLPIDLMAERGKDTARFSCMKPIGLEIDEDQRPYAVVQLRKENLLGSAYNLVGFQTRLTYREQVRVFRMIPGLENASFIHLGSVHRNTFLNAKKLLHPDLSSIKYPQISFAGQMTGVEGYTESASMGLYVAFQVLRKIQGQEPLLWPKETCIGALVNYLMTQEKPTPSNINFGLLPTIDFSKEELKSIKGSRKMARKEKVAQRSQLVFQDFCQTHLSSSLPEASV